MTTMTLDGAVRRAVSGVDDPEFPGVSIADLGIPEDVRVDPETANVEIDLVPTFLGCPALRMIEDDVRRAADAVPGVNAVTVRFLSQPQWSLERVTPRGRRLLADAFTVAVPSDDEAIGCPVCSGRGVEIRSPFGPTACRAIGYCSSCLNPVEVMRD